MNSPRCAWPSPWRGARCAAACGGFRLFLACLALGVGAIAAILSFSRAVQEGLHADARELLGGDVAISLLVSRGHAGATRLARPSKAR